ncbi:alpha/beta fold hydrolase [Methylocystis iwaonis]|uniref:Epoxide hydrolase n=1 Tax=Methylocystis iwaonis TaxID=2885079 RepID=A0ABM8E915_9HYPH|nr:alpha/beta hydrolase [Methylocystis iwaonis]BDV34472.1 epoxide hydrolase [Methylocystis iwaonis]
MKAERRAFLVGSSHAILFRSSLAAAQPLATDDPTATPLPRGGMSHFAQLNGVRLHYVSVGSGPTVILLHGWPQTWFAWRGAMERLSSRFTCVALDLRGLGLSEKTPAGYDKQTIAADVAALIDHVAGGRAHVVGHDMGGKAAFVLANLQPGKVEKLVLVDCLVPGTENMDARRGGAWHYGFHMAPEIPEMLTRGREREYIAAQIRAWSHKKDAVSEAAISEFARHYASAGGMTAGFAYYRALRDDAALVASFENRKLEAPVLAITGRYASAKSSRMRCVRTRLN